MLNTRYHRLSITLIKQCIEILSLWVLCSAFDEANEKGADNQIGINALKSRVVTSEQEQTHSVENGMKAIHYALPPVHQVT